MRRAHIEHGTHASNMSAMHQLQGQRRNVVVATAGAPAVYASMPLPCVMYVHGVRAASAAALLTADCEYSRYPRCNPSRMSCATTFRCTWPNSPEHCQ